MKLIIDENIVKEYKIDIAAIEADIVKSKEDFKAALLELFQKEDL